MHPLHIKFFQYLEDIGEQNTPLGLKLLNPDKFEVTLDDLHVKADLNLDNTSVTSLPDGLKVDGHLDLRDCIYLTSLPDGLKVGGSLYLSRCTGLTSLPDGLKVGGSLYLNECTSLTTLPDNLEVGGDLILYGCTSLTSLPDGLKVGQIFDVRKTFLASKTTSKIRRMVPGFKGEILK